MCKQIASFVFNKVKTSKGVEKHIQKVIFNSWLEQNPTL
jgi:hypothetical protein